MRKRESVSCCVEKREVELITSEAEFLLASPENCLEKSIFSSDNGEVIETFDCSLENSRVNARTTAERRDFYMDEFVSCCGKATELLKEVS